MLRISGIGLALALVCAISAGAASTASAADPEFGGSVKQTFKGTSGTGTIASTVGEITCSSDSSTGEVTGTSQIGKVVVTFSGCVAKEGEKACTAKSAGGATGKIVTKTLMGELGLVSKSEAPSGAGLLVLPETAKVLATIEAACLAPALSSLEGSVVGEASPVGGLSTTATLGFAGGAGKQSIKEIGVLGTTVKPKLLGFGAVTVSEDSTEALTFNGAIGVIGPSPTQPQFLETGAMIKIKGGKSAFRNTTSTITCEKDSGEGEVSGLSSIEVTSLTFEGCSGTVGGKKCPSTISTKVLAGELGTVASSESASEIGTLFKPKEGTTLASIECETLKVALAGSVASEVEVVSETTEESNLLFTPSGSGMKIKSIKTTVAESPKLELDSEPASLESTLAIAPKTKGIRIGFCGTAANATYESWWKCRWDLAAGLFAHGWERFWIF
jgi:hypothetical protein